MDGSRERQKGWFGLHGGKSSRIAEEWQAGWSAQETEGISGLTTALSVGLVIQATVHREGAVLSHILGKALEWRWIKPKLPTEGFKLDNAKLNYLTSEKVQRVLETAKRDQSFEIYPFLLVATATGMRIAEILSVRCEHIDLDRRLIHIPKAKAGSRDQPITKSLAEYLSGRIEQMRPDLCSDVQWKPTGRLFPSPRNSAEHMVAIQKPFRRVIAGAGLDPSRISRHSLRHTAITHPRSGWGRSS